MPEHGHLRRLDVVWQRQPLYFITVCVHRRRPLLNSAGVHAIFREEWMSWRKRDGWTVGRYVIMPDHIHLVHPFEVRERLAHACSGFTRWRNHTRCESGHVFRRLPPPD